MIHESYNEIEAKNWIRDKPITLSDFVCIPAIIREIKADLNLINFNLLDVGCGEGFLTRQLAHLFQKVEGIDYSSAMISLAKKQAKRDNLHYQTADMCKINLVSETFDFITAVSSLHYLKDNSELEKAFKETFRLLKKEGIFIFSVIHPCFNTLPGTPPDNYFTNQSFFGEISSIDGKKLKIGGYQHQISDYINLLVKVGFKVEKMIEPEVPSGLMEKFPDFFERNKTVPQFMIIKARK